MAIEQKATTSSKSHEHLHRCSECRHSRVAPDSDPDNGWRTCAAGQRGGWPMEERWCTTFQPN